MKSIARTSDAVSRLKEFLREGDLSSRRYPAFPSYNLGRPTFALVMPVQTFIERSEVANERSLDARLDWDGDRRIAQRKLDPKHAQGLATYMLKAAVEGTLSRFDSRWGDGVYKYLEIFHKQLGSQPYYALQPIVANIRTVDHLEYERSEQGAITLTLAESDLFWVIDGQHRRYGMELLTDYLKEILMRHLYPRRPALYSGAHRDEMGPEEVMAWQKVYETFRTNFKVMIEAHVGLGVDEERQLFHDLNNLGKKVEASLAFEFDQANAVNAFIKDELLVKEDEGGFWKPEVVERDVVNWDDDEGVISRKDVIAVNALLLLNKTNIKGALPLDVVSKKEIALRFWEQVNTINGFGEPGAKDNTVSAQPVMLKALAKLTHDFAFGRQRNEEHLEMLLDGLTKIDFSHENDLWAYYELSQKEQEQFKGLRAYLPDAGTGNRDIGKRDAKGRMRFGSKHNDIYPILGDMIRWQLRLPSRHEG